MTQTNVERVHYNVICDEGVSMRCSNAGCRLHIMPETSMVISYDGTVFCSEQCAHTDGASEAS